MEFKSLFLGYLLGTFFNQKKKFSRNQNKNINKTTKTYKKIFEVNNKSNKPITEDDISINIKTDSNSSKNQNTSPETEKSSQKAARPNFIPLNIFWAHFQAYQKGLLKENKPAPWEIHKQENYDTKWALFLKQMVDENWPEWINNEKEVKKRSLKAFKKIENK